MRYRPLRLLISIILISHLSSAAAILLVPANAASLLTSAPGRVESFASLIGSFSFTMAGFLAAILALFGVMSGSTLLARYQRRGYLGVLLLVVGMTVLELVTTFAFSLRLFFAPPTQLYLCLLAWLVTTSLVMLLLSTLPIVMLVKGTIDSLSQVPQP